MPNTFISQKTRAERYRRKLQDLHRAAADFTGCFAWWTLNDEESAKFDALVDEIAIVGSQLTMEDRYNELMGDDDEHSKQTLMTRRSVTVKKSRAEWQCDSCGNKIRKGTSYEHSWTQNTGAEIYK